MKYSIIKYKDTIKESSSGRLDSEFYTPEIMNYLSYIKAKRFDLLGNLTDILTDYHANGSYELLRNNVQLLDNEDYALMIRTVDFENNDFESNVKYISKASYNFLKKTKIYGNELVINKIGNAGNVYLMPTLNRPVSLGMNLFMIKLKDIKLSPIIFVYLNTIYGKSLIKRRVTGAVPLSIDKESVREVIVPIFKEMFVDLIGQLVYKYFKLNKNQKEVYNAANKIILKEFAYHNFEQRNKHWSVKNYSDVKDANRLDAEYFQPKYDKVIKSIKNYSSGYDKLKNIVKIKDANFIPKSKEEYKYIELANILKSGEINNCTVDFGYNLPTRARRIVSTGDVIVSSIEGALDSIALITNDNNNSLCSTGFYVINSNSINSETLFCLLKSEFIQMQLKRGCSGTILTAINKDEFGSIILPKIKNNVQIQIKENIQEMYKLKRQSKQLLEIAKRGVEIAIEQDEDIATSWINQELQKIGVEL